MADFCGEKMVGVARIELATPAMSTKCLHIKILKISYFCPSLWKRNENKEAILTILTALLPQRKSEATQPLSREAVLSFVFNDVSPFSRSVRIKAYQGFARVWGKYGRGFMIIIPELRLVVILTPRTGTRSLKNAVARKYPQSFLLYRHMEADGVPYGYDRWPKVGVVRDPVDRLWSLYKYLKRFGIDWCAEHDETYTARMRQSVAASFGDWLLNNELVFTSPYDSAGLGRFYPAYSCRHPLPENRKSQFHYLRPDLGTEIVKYNQVADFWDRLDLIDCRQNDTDETPPPALNSQEQAYINLWFRWDIEAVQSYHHAKATAHD